MHKSILTYFLIFFFTFCLSINAFGKDSTKSHKNRTLGDVIARFPVSKDSTKSHKNPALKMNLRSLLVHLIKNNEEIKNYQNQVAQAKAEYRKSQSLYYPTMDLTADGGREKINKEYTKNTTENRYNVTLKAKQLITDFGKTNNTIERSDILLDQAKARLESQQQQLMIEGIRAYINIIRARDRLKTAHRSESRIKELTGIEKTLVKKGAGLSSDVLQAKSQLAGAMALSVETQGELNIAKNRFQAVFDHALSNKETAQLKTIEFPSKKLPLNLKDAFAIAIKQNQELLITRYDSQVAQKDIKIARAVFYPQFNLFAKALRKDNEDGIEVYSNELSAGVECRYNIFNGGGDKAALRSAIAFQKAISYHIQFVLRIIKEQVSNSWDQLLVQKQRSELLDQQADILKSFLSLAKKERKMGTRSLLDVLNGEVNYINSIATSIAARQDTKIAAYNLLFAMGSIRLGLF